ncbi:MAG: hypothetical protein OWV35_11690 [Firmicutes bacterium]|nr:hypothetical protein [Bacillota bacterium]
MAAWKVWREGYLAREGEHRRYQNQRSAIRGHLRRQPPDPRAERLAQWGVPTGAIAAAARPGQGLTLNIRGKPRS